MKQRYEDLAICGGEPSFSERLHVGRPNIGDRNGFMNRVASMIDRRWLTNNGPYVQELEKKTAELLDAKHSIAVCNATVGLEILARALGLSGEVIIPSFTFIATPHSLYWQQIKPVFCEIDPKTHNIDPKRIQSLITPRTSGILGVHVWGRPCDIDALSRIAKKNGLKLFFDAAHAFGCAYQGRMIGNFGEAEVFSFHATKFLNSFEGGLITTNNDELAEKIRLMKNFGFKGLDNVIYVGTNGKMTEICAAMGLSNLDHLDRLVEANYRNYCAYRRELGGIPGIEMINYNEGERNNFQYIVVMVDAGEAKIERDLLVKVLHAENVLARRYFYPGCHRMEPYRSSYSREETFLPETEKVSGSVMILPSGETLKEDHIRDICQVIRLAVENAERLTARGLDEKR